VTLYDISAPYDLRVALKKPVISTTEIDSMLADPAVDEAVKQQLLEDVEPQGYQRPRNLIPAGMTIGEYRALKREDPEEYERKRVEAERMHSQPSTIHSWTVPKNPELLKPWAPPRKRWHENPWVLGVGCIVIGAVILRLIGLG